MEEKGRNEDGGYGKGQTWEVKEMGRAWKVMEMNGDEGYEN